MKKSQLKLNLIFAITFFVIPTLVIILCSIPIDGDSGDIGALFSCLSIFYIIDVFLWISTIKLAVQKSFEKKIFLFGKRCTAKLVDYTLVGEINNEAYYSIKYSYDDGGKIYTERSTDMFRYDFIQLVSLVRFFPIMVYQGKSAICKNCVEFVLKEYETNKKFFETEYDEKSADKLYDNVSKKYGYTGEAISQKYIRICKYCGCQLEDGKTKCMGCGSSDFKIKKL